MNDKCIYTKGSSQSRGFRNGTFNIRSQPKVAKDTKVCTVKYGHTFYTNEKVSANGYEWYKIRLSEEDLDSKDCDPKVFNNLEGRDSIFDAYIPTKFAAEASSEDKCYRYQGLSTEEFNKGVNSEEEQSAGKVCLLCDKFDQQELNAKEYGIYVDFLDAVDRALDFCENCDYDKSMQTIKGKLKGSALTRVDINACHTEPWFDLNLDERLDRIQMLVDRNAKRQSYQNFPPHLIQCIVAKETGGTFSPTSITSAWKNSSAQGLTHIVRSTYKDTYKYGFRSSMPRYRNNSTPNVDDLYKDAELQIESALGVLFRKAESLGRESSFKSGKLFNSPSELNRLIFRYHSSSQTYANRVSSCKMCMDKLDNKKYLNSKLSNEEKEKYQVNRISCLKKSYPATGYDYFERFKKKCDSFKSLYKEYYEARKKN